VFNLIRRDAVLAAIATSLPSIYKFCCLSYQNTSYLQYDEHIISSQEGVQQSDPLGPLLFCLTVHPLLSSLTCKLVVGYMDDFSLGGPTADILTDLALISSQQSSLGLRLNPIKCEIISDSKSSHPAQLDNFITVQPSHATLLGVPLSTEEALEAMLASVLADLERSVDRLSNLTSHDALLLKNCLGGPKLLHILRTAPCCNHPFLTQFDNLLRSALSHICNLTFTDDQWKQASLPVRNGGLGVRSVAQLASSAFLASAASTLPLQSRILRNFHLDAEDNFPSVNTWKSLSNCSSFDDVPTMSQKALDTMVANNAFNELLSQQTDPYHQARLLAASAAHSGDWIHALPITACGLRLNDEEVRIAAGMRLGVELCQPHQCPCGAMVDARATHAFACKRNPGRSQRHHFINDLIYRAMSRAQIPSTKEPHGLSRTDGKRPDGMSLIPWRDGRCVTWDVTIIDTTAQSYLTSTARCAASAAELAAKRKESKYAVISSTHHFCPIALETMGPINSLGTEFISELGRRISRITDDARETAFFFQRLSVAVQRFNSVCFISSFSSTGDKFLPPR
ncbi:MAG TPA: hypothetical protein VLS45_02715, partial [Methylomicrobium sp.]|nr:hypothetical protein [Methylomicrobium sp.]